jgi:putative transposase
MGQSLSEIYIHTAFSTKNRQPLIKDNMSARLFEYVAGVSRSLECPTISVGGYLDHIHILFMLSKKIALSKFLQEVKGSSSKWIKTIDDDLAHFQWQEGYGAFSVSKHNILELSQYIKNQAHHHATTDFKTELLALLQEHGIKYDERYLWD